MKIIIRENLPVLVPTIKPYLKEKEGNYVFKEAYLPKSMTIEKCEEIYEEVYG